MARVRFDPTLLDDKHALPARLWQMTTTTPATSPATPTTFTVSDAALAAQTVAQLQLVVDYVVQRMTSAGL